MDSREEFVRQRKETLEACSNPDIADVIERNIGSILELRQRVADKKSLQDRFADVITQFSGDMKFFYLHVIAFGLWILWNSGVVTGAKPFDGYPFNFLTLIVSLEAIFLSTFVLISQNRMTEVADQRADLDLQINLLAEYEITKILVLVDAIAHKLELEEAKDPEIDQLTSTTAPDLIMDEIHQKEQVAKQLERLARKGTIRLPKP